MLGEIYSVFAVSCVLSAAARFGMMMSSDEVLTVRKTVGVVLRHGLIGGAVGVAAYDYIEFRTQTPEGRVIIASVFYGAGLLTVKAIWISIAPVLKGLLADHARHRNETDN